jgi:hypothetical protein
MTFEELVVCVQAAMNEAGWTDFSVAINRHCRIVENKAESDWSINMSNYPATSGGEWNGKKLAESISVCAPTADLAFKHFKGKLEMLIETERHLAGVAA